MKIKDVVIALLITIVLALLVYIVTDKFSKNKKESSKEPDVVNKDDSNESNTVISSTYKTKIGSKEYTVDVDETKYMTKT